VHIRVHSGLVVEVPHDTALYAHTFGRHKLGEVANVKVLGLEVQAVEVFGGDDGSIAQIT
jgi:hypothetical protein